MSRTVRLTPLRVALAGAALAGVAALAGTGGAVAATLVTSSDIADHTIRARDINQSALTTFTKLQGYTVVTNEQQVGAGEDAFLIGTCPGDSRVLGVTGFWDGRADAVQTLFLSDGTGAVASVHDAPAADLLIVRVTCAAVF